MLISNYFAGYNFHIHFCNSRGLNQNLSAPCFKIFFKHGEMALVMYRTFWTNMDLWLSEVWLSYPKMDQTLYPVKWSAPHRTCQRLIERVCAYLERIRAHGRVVIAGGKTPTLARRPCPHPLPMCPHAEIPVRAHGYPSAPMGTRPRPQVWARTCIELV
jgi:hypothetical protein